MLILVSEISIHYQPVCCFGQESDGNCHSQLRIDRESTMIGILIW
ncbi:MAG: hypothetical protein RMY28_026895 [Nostoc sp. ChiSLP01]